VDAHLDVVRSEEPGLAQEVERLIAQRQVSSHTVAAYRDTFRLLLAFAHRLERKAWPYVGCGLLCVLSTCGIVFGSGAWVVAAATVQGFANAVILILILALPPLLSASDDVHRVTAAMFTISYSCAVIVPVISGLAWDISGTASLAFAPIAICGIILVILAPAINHVRPAGS